MYKLCYFVFESYFEKIKNVLFEVGVGWIGDYDSCVWQCCGQGQFWLLVGSDLFLGKQGELEVVEEYRVELVCEDVVISVMLEVLKQVYLYEEFVYEVYWMEMF